MKYNQQLWNQLKLTVVIWPPHQELRDQLQNQDDKGEESSEAGDSRASLLEALSNFTSTNARLKR